MKRLFFYFALAASLLLAAATATAWILGTGEVCDLYATPWKPDPGVYYRLWTWDGQVALERDDHIRNLKGAHTAGIRDVSTWTAVIVWHRSYDGVDSAGAVVYHINSTRMLCLPLLLAGLVLPTVALMVFLHRRSMRRTSTAHCPACGYDLRAHRRGDKCPECGTLIPPLKAAIMGAKPRSPS